MSSKHEFVVVVRSARPLRATGMASRSWAGVPGNPIADFRPDASHLLVDRLDRVSASVTKSTHLHYQRPLLARRRRRREDVSSSSSTRRSRQSHPDHNGIPALAHDASRHGRRRPHANSLRPGCPKTRWTFAPYSASPSPCTRDISLIMNSIRRGRAYVPFCRHRISTA